ncbi:MAG: hypothetical protein M3P89_14290 [Actinomycetota bacterium]|nr:hypothetical protein [Actinomycetota bacterium]
MEPIKTQREVDVAAIRARLSAITEGPWSRHGSDVYAPGDQVPLVRGRDGSAVVRGQADADAEFIAHAPSDIAALIDFVQQQPGGGSAEEAIGR